MLDDLSPIVPWHQGDRKSCSRKEPPPRDALMLCIQLNWTTLGYSVDPLLPVLEGASGSSSRGGGESVRKWVEDLWRREPPAILSNMHDYTTPLLTLCRQASTLMAGRGHVCKLARSHRGILLPPLPSTLKDAIETGIMIGGGLYADNEEPKCDLSFYGVRWAPRALMDQGSYIALARVGNQHDISSQGDHLGYGRYHLLRCYGRPTMGHQWIDEAQTLRLIKARSHGCHLSPWLSK